MDSRLKTELIYTVDVKNTLGEGIQWHAERSEIWWTDIVNNQLFCLHWPTKELTQFSTPEPVCSFAFIENIKPDTLKLLIAFASGIAYYFPESEQIEWIHQNITDARTARLNDGRVDRQGRFWVGSMSLVNSDFEQNNGRGKLFRLDQNENLTIQEDNILISNGTCWSPDSKFMYFADSPTHEMYRYNFDADTGENSKREIFKTTEPHAFPDGSCVDADGFIWNAQWGAGKVARYKHDGELDAEVNIPVSQPSCVAFGGEDLNLLLVTTARQDLNEDALKKQPDAGKVFIFKTNATGLPESKYKSNNIDQ